MAAGDRMKPDLTIIINFHEMRREARRTLYTLSPAYQRGVTASDYQVIALDNGSESRLGSEYVTEFGPNFEYHYINTASKSPAAAANFGVKAALAENIGWIVDGARMLTPGVILHTLRALNLYNKPFVCALAWHLGPNVQKVSMLEGYDQDAEDKLLDSIDWRNNGYKLFEISTLAPSSRVGFLGGMPRECSWFAMRKAAYLDLGGIDDRFQSPGGGLVNHDFLERVIWASNFDLVVLLGEGTFHQFHGGAVTNAPPDARPSQVFAEEYHRIHGRRYQGFAQPPVSYLGGMPPSAMRFLASAQRPM